MSMKVKGTIIHKLGTGEHVLILLAENKAEQQKLYHYLTIDAMQFKQEIATEAPKLDFITAGFKNTDGKVIFNEDYIEMPKWFDLN